MSWTTRALAPPSPSAMTFQIRPAEPSDAPRIAEIYRPVVEASPASFELEAPGPAEMVRRMEQAGDALPWLVCTEGGMVVGYAYASPFRSRPAYRWSTEASVYVAPSARRRGVGRGLYNSLLRVLRAQGFFNVCAGITLPNPASVALHESVGFRPVGVYRQVGFKGGAWHDVGWWQVVLQSGGTPDPPVPVSALARDASLPELLRAGLPFIREPKAVRPGSGDR